jgi:hypothetical protein
MCGQLLTLSEGGTTVTKTQGPNQWNAAVLGTSSVEEYSAKIVKTGHIRLGLAPANGFQINGKNTTCYYMYLITGSIYKFDENGKPYASRVSSGSIITVSYNKEKREISYIIDDKNYGVAFTDVTGELYPAIDIWERGCVVSLMYQ